MAATDTLGNVHPNEERVGLQEHQEHRATRKSLHISMHISASSYCIATHYSTVFLSHLLMEIYDVSCFLFLLLKTMLKLLSL